MEYFGETKNEGFSLLELILALAIGLIILGVLVNSFIAQRTNYDYQEQQVEMIQTARAAMDMISGEIIMGGYDPLGKLQRKNSEQIDFSGVVYNADQLEVRGDLDGSGSIAGGSGTNPESWTFDENERIVYRLDEEMHILRRKLGGAGATFQPFAENVTAFSFAYFDANGNKIEDEANTGDIRQVQIRIEMETEKPVVGKGKDETIAETVVKIRNMGLTKPVLESGSSTTTTTTTTTSTTSTSSTSSSITSSTTSVSTSSTSSSSTSSTSTSTSTSTTVSTVPPPPIEHYDECGESVVGVNLEACSEGSSDYILARVYIEKDGAPYTKAVVNWWINEDVGAVHPRILVQKTGQPGWYGGSTLCGCGTFIHTFSCGKSDNKYEKFTLHVTIFLPEPDGECLLEFEDTSG
jgi:prepilin-type N-terminal cleavage/methylation domain-containing protein